MTPPLKLEAMSLICCSQLPIALQTLFAYASLAFVSELLPQPAAVDLDPLPRVRVVENDLETTTHAYVLMALGQAEESLTSELRQPA